MKPPSILFVCMGNICRSPTAEAVMRDKISTLKHPPLVDSAGTIGFHQGKPADPRAQDAAKKRGYDLSALRARQVTQADFETFDYILAADRDNLEDLSAICPEQYRSKLRLLLSYSGSDIQEVPDPYYGGEQGFEQVLDLIEDACDGLIEAIQVSSRSN
ncbi:low molecular weight protein-tyrosine-phosphatase [Dongshaea marina]|uniref:low molecular weight protein-tyrosine-phosphatase n=1 Tax=Dongshaea marina TaxID=2047966 RepID=UPI000D3E53AC|nr:low molecular weight protein-tyrosine-phosphatase [Dongshaea marina]